MKKFILFAALALIAAGCGAGEGRDHSTGFKIAPGSVSEFTIPNKSHNTSFTAGSSVCGPSASCYSIVFVGTVGGTSYVGIALSNDPSAENYKVMIYLPNLSSVPVGDFELTSANSIIKVWQNGNEYSGQTGNITLNFSEEQTDNTYIITGVAGNKTVSIGGQDLTINSIVAYKVGS